MAKALPDPLFTMHSGMQAVHCIFHRTICNGQSLIYCGTETGFVHVWDYQMLRQVHKTKVCSQPCVSILHHKVTFITQEKGGDITFWKENDLTWNKIRSFPCDFKMFCKMLLFNDILIHPCSDNQVKFTDITDLSKMNLEGVSSEALDEAGMVMCAKYSTKHSSLILAFENGSICTVNPSDGELVSSVKFNSDCPICFDYCDSANFGIVGYSSKDVIKFSLNGNREPQKIRNTELTNPGSSSIAIRSDGMLFVIGLWDNTVKYFSAKSLKLLAVLNHHNLPVECLCFIPNSNYDFEGDKKEYCLLAGSRDGRVSLWDLYPPLPRTNL